MENVRLSVSDFIALTNQTLDYAYPTVEIEGEVQSYKVNQGKFVFFDLKDESSSVGCFMMLFQLRIPLEDGMKVVITASPKLTNWGKFSLTVRSIRPVGEGSLKRSFELLVKKLQSEGLFDAARKRALPAMPECIGVITSKDSAGYSDFIKVLSDRWGGMKIDVAHVQVQGEVAPDQIIRALEYFNQLSMPPQVLVIIRGGGSADDLTAFNDEPLARAVAASRVPTLTGIGHEVDTSLVDMVADVRAATPSNAAQLLTPSREEIRRSLVQQQQAAITAIFSVIDTTERRVESGRLLLLDRFYANITSLEQRTVLLADTLRELNPHTVLERGYAMIKNQDGRVVSGEQIRVGQELTIETKHAIIKTGVTHVKKR
jgi:exodeoxyribonuclease VII large subunit